MCYATKVSFVRLLRDKMSESLIAMERMLCQNILKSLRIVLDQLFNRSMR